MLWSICFKCFAATIQYGSLCTGKKNNSGKEVASDYFINYCLLMNMEHVLKNKWISALVIYNDCNTIKRK